VSSGGVVPLKGGRMTLMETIALLMLIATVVNIVASYHNRK
jgi:hypothetical protein